MEENRQLKRQKKALSLPVDVVTEVLTFLDAALCARFSLVSKSFRKLALQNAANQIQRLTLLNQYERRFPEGLSESSLFFRWGILENRKDVPIEFNECCEAVEEIRTINSLVGRTCMRVPRV